MNEMVDCERKNEMVVDCETVDDDYKMIDCDHICLMIYQLIIFFFFFLSKSDLAPELPAIANYTTGMMTW